MLGGCSLASRIQLSVWCVDDGVKCAAASSLLCESIVGAHTTDWLADWRGSGLLAQAAAAARRNLGMSGVAAAAATAATAAAYRILLLHSMSTGLRLAASQSLIDAGRKVTCSLRGCRYTDRRTLPLAAAFNAAT